jgi:tetratricopeptide (TPR) repeat protein
MRDPVELALLRAERAAFLGRQGQVELAREQLREIQRQFSPRPHVAVSAAVALAEGQIDHYSHLTPTAHDRFKRAHALSAAAQLRRLQAVSAAWLAHTYEARGDHPRMASLSAEAMSLADADHHAAHWRVGLTVGNAYHFAGRLDRARPWYASSRRHALAYGDEVALSALMHNQAAVRASHARMAAAFGGVSQAEAVEAVMGAESSARFDAHMGLQSSDWMVPMLRAQLLVLEERFDEALEFFDRQWDRADPGWRQRMQPCLLADRAWCLLQTGAREQAREEMEQAAKSLDGRCEIDDQALAHARLAQLHAAFGHAAESVRHWEQAEADRATHEGVQRQVVLLLDEALAGMEPALHGRSVEKS